MTREELKELGLSEEQTEQVCAWHGEEVDRLRGAMLEQAIRGALTAAGARNQKVVRAALDFDRLTLDEDGILTGLEEQLSALKKSDGYLFAGATGQRTAEAHFDSGGSHGLGTAVDYSKMSDAEYYAAVLKK